MILFSIGNCVCAWITMESPGTTGPSNTLLVLQLKSLVAYKSNDEYLYAMKEDLAEWFMCLYQLDITVDNFFEILETGVILCEHANKVKGYADEQRQLGRLAVIQSNFVRRLEIPLYEVPYRKEVKPQTFHARDNISNFITWTKDLGIPDVLSFETDDLVLRKNEKSVVLCLLEIARIGAKLGMLAPTLVQMEEEIDAEIESGEPPPQIITCDIKSLDEMVSQIAQSVQLFLLYTVCLHFFSKSGHTVSVLGNTLFIMCPLGAAYISGSLNSVHYNEVRA